MCAHFPLSLFTPLSLTSSYQGTNGSQLWDSAFAAQAFLEVRTKQDVWLRCMTRGGGAIWSVCTCTCIHACKCVVMCMCVQLV